MNYQLSELKTWYKNKPQGYYSLDRDEMVEFIPKTVKKILDVGCGEGGFGKTVKTSFPEKKIWGIEPNQASALIASSVLDNVINVVFEEGIEQLKDEKFDCIVFNDVLEHFVNPERALEQCEQYLATEGYILASIPNILYFPVIREILTSQDWKYQQHGTLDNTHLRFFTKKSIIRLFEDNGYEIVTIKGINPARCGKIYNLLNTVFYKKLKDWRYLQFAVLAKRRVGSQLYANGTQQ